MTTMQMLEFGLIDSIADYEGNRYQVTHYEDDFVIAVRMGDYEVFRIPADMVNNMIKD